MVKQCEDRERERDLYPHPITAQTRQILRNVGLLKFYQEDTSLKGNSVLLGQLIRHWDRRWKKFTFGPDQWVQLTKEDVYLITRLSNSGDYFPQFLYIPTDTIVES